MDEFSARCAGNLQLANSTTTDSDTQRDSIVLHVKLSRRPAETYPRALVAMHYSRHLNRHYVKHARFTVPHISMKNISI